MLVKNKTECPHSHSGGHIWGVLRITRRDMAGNAVEAIKACRRCEALWIGQDKNADGSWTAKTLSQIGIPQLSVTDLNPETGEPK